MRYTWDADKAEQNLRKHGVSFEQAVLVFDDEHCVIDADGIDEITGEQRWQAIGAVRSTSGELAVLLFVVHVYREA